MNLVLFGAGASYGSDSRNTPPLGAKLFDELAARYPDSWGLQLPWPNQFRASFETAMATFIAQGNFAAPLQWDMAEYFFKGFPIGSNNLYIQLLKRVKPFQQDFVLATLNYDTLLLQASISMGIQLEIGFPTRSPNKLPLMVPHGASMICCAGIKASPGIRISGFLTTGGRARIFTDGTDFENEKKTNVFPPVMSYYEPNKFTPSCNNFIQQERNSFKVSCHSATKIALIGVRVHSADGPIWGPLAGSPAKLFYVGGSDKPVFDAWSQQHGRTDKSIAKTFYDGFDDVVSFFGI